jgi:hypothetical protein
MKIVANAFTFVTLVALAAFTSPGLSAAPGVRSRSYDVVSPVWITHDGDPSHSGKDDGNREPRALIFPSLASSESAPGPLRVPLQNFFRPQNRFHEKAFAWSAFPDSRTAIELRISRSGADAVVDIDIASMSQIRKLSWEEFGQLQGAFRNWLFDHSNCWFGNCEARFTDGFRDNLIALWKDHVLKEATFENFAIRYLNESTKRNFAVSYAGTPALEALGIEMHATRIGSGETLSIVWGSTTVYPAIPAGVSSGYVRSSMGGTSELRISEHDGLHLFPWKTPATVPVAEGKNSLAKNLLLPFREEWITLIGSTEKMPQPVFLPIYNLLDLHDFRLLRDTKSAPRYMFLLTPEKYIKADTGPGLNQIAQFATDGREGREADDNKANSAAQLARRFILIGCKTSDEACPRKELIVLLDQAFNATSPLSVDGKEPVQDLSAPRPAYTAGVFANQTFVEVRHRISVNGHPIETAVSDRETWGDVIAAWMFSKVDRSGVPGSPAILEVRRTTRNEEAVSETMRLLFHTTAGSVLNHAEVFEGDEFYGRSDVQALLLQ